MNSEEQDKFKEIIAAISETYKEEFTPAMTKLWWRIFKNQPIEVFERAVYAHISCEDDGMFFPKPANIMRVINGTTKDNERLIKDRAEIAWACIEREIARIGGHGGLELEDKQALAAVKAIGGWGRLCSCTYDQLTWKKKELVSAYDTYERTDLAELPSKLPGLTEMRQHKKDHQSVQAFLPGIVKRK